MNPFLPIRDVPWRREDWLWLLFLVSVYLLFWIPVLKVHPPLSTGDNGRDLYAFWMTTVGKRPCWDYWWQYGPSMLVYYAFWFLVGGVNIVSARVGLAFNYFLCSFFAYRTLRHFTSGFIAFLSSLAFLSYGMTWTYNHLGTIPFLLISISCLWKFFMTHQTRWCYGALLSLVGVASVKINTGISTFAALYASLLLHQGFFLCKHLKAPLKVRHFVFLPLLFSVLVSGIYAPVYFGFSMNQISYCLSVEPRYHTHSLPWTNFKHLILRFVVWEPTRLWGVGFLLVLALLAGLGLKKRGVEKEKITLFSFVVISLILLGLATTAEYFVIHSIIYRFDFWFFPILVLILGLCAEWGSFLFSRKMKFCLGGLLFFLLLWFPSQSLKEALAWRVPERYLDMPHGRVYLGGLPSNVEVVRKGTQFILDHTKPHEEILAVPYEPLYCFLSARRHAVPEQSFTQTFPLVEGREAAIIQQLEAEQILYVILSNRYYSTEEGVGQFGKTHCEKLAKYIFENYEEAATFGPWNPPSAYPHAIKIFQRKNPG